jgi:hypothetical protein
MLRQWGKGYESYATPLAISRCLGVDAFSMIPVAQQCEAAAAMTKDEEGHL